MQRKKTWKTSMSIPLWKLAEDLARREKAAENEKASHRSGCVYELHNKLFPQAKAAARVRFPKRREACSSTVSCCRCLQRRSRSPLPLIQTLHVQVLTYICNARWTDFGLHRRRIFIVEEVFPRCYDFDVAAREDYEPQDRTKSRESEPYCVPTRGMFLVVYSLVWQALGNRLPRNVLLG